MTQIVINQCFGGYGLSEKAYEYLGIEWDRYGFAFEDDRSNPKLVECVLKLGSEASGLCADLTVVEVPDDVEWEISYYDGNEHVAEKHRTWP
jgi:hypothetical protein